MKDTKKKYNSNNITSWISIFILLASAIATIFNYIDLKNPTIQGKGAVIFIAEILITVTFMLIMRLDSIQLDLHDIKESLDDLYDLKQVNDVRSTVNKRHVEKLLNNIEKTINDTCNGGKINEESKN